MKLKSTQAQQKAAIAEYCEINGQYGVVINVSGVPVGNHTGNKKGKFRKNPQMSGMADILICWLGQFIYVELKKTKSESLRDSQKEHKRRSTKAGALWWTVLDFDEFIIKMGFYRKGLR